MPCHNEEECVGRVVEELSAMASAVHRVDAGGKTLDVDMAAYDWEFLFVDDGSTDSTAARLEELRRQDGRIAVLTLTRNFGKENAMLAGMDYARGDAIVILDADLQDPVSVIPEMTYWWEQGYDDVYGHRASRGREPLLRRRLTMTFYRMLDSMSRIDILENVGDFRLLDARAVRTLCRMRETQRYMKGLYCWVGFRKKGVEYRRGERRQGKSSYKMGKLFNLAIDGLTSYSTKPLRISIVVGLIVSLLAFAYLGFILLKTLLWGEEVSGFPTLICVILFLGGMQLLALGIIGEYVGRIFNETKRRPPYVADRYNNEKVKID